MVFLFSDHIMQRLNQANDSSNRDDSQHRQVLTNGLTQQDWQASYDALRNAQQLPILGSLLPAIELQNGQERDRIQTRTNTLSPQEMREITGKKLAQMLTEIQNLRQRPGPVGEAERAAQLPALERSLRDILQIARECCPTPADRQQLVRHVNSALSAPTETNLRVHYNPANGELSLFPRQYLESLPANQQPQINPLYRFRIPNQNETRPDRPIEAANSLAEPGHLSERQRGLRGLTREEEEADRDARYTYNQRIYESTQSASLRATADQVGAVVRTLMPFRILENGREREIVRPTPEQIRAIQDAFHSCPPEQRERLASCIGHVLRRSGRDIQYDPVRQEVHLVRYLSPSEGSSIVQPPIPVSYVDR